MQIKEFMSSMAKNDNRLPPQPASYRFEVIAEFKSVDDALSFHEELITLISRYREPEPTKGNK